MPWFWLMQTRFSGFYDYFFVYQHFQRFAAAGFNNAQPFWFYLPVIVGLALPWSLWGGGILRKTFWTGPTRELPAGGYLGGGHSGVLLAAGVQAGGLCAADLPPLAFLLAEVVVAAWRNEHDTITPRLVRISASAGAFICVLAVGIAGHNARGSAEPLADVIRPQLQADDTFVSLHAYPFDLALYMRAPPSWVVDDWLNPEIPIRDNWRKELYDAAKFDPAVGRQVLISNEEFKARLCAAPDGARYWVWGNNSDGRTTRRCRPDAGGDQRQVPDLEGRGRAGAQAAGLWRNAQSRLTTNVSTASPIRIKASSTS